MVDEPLDDATSVLWGRLARPFPLAEAIDALIGLSPDAVHQLAGARLCTSPEAVDLRAAMPGLTRALTTSVNGFPVRSRGQIRGPVLWSETMSARAATYGDDDLFVCTAPQRDYDTPENRVLLQALTALSDSGRAVERIGAGRYDDEELRAARANARVARLFLDHPAFARVSHDRLRPRLLKRVRGSKSALRYRPALAVLERAAEPLPIEDLTPYCDRRTRLQHQAVLGIVVELERRGMRIPAFRVEDGTLLAGPLTYIHPRRLGVRDHLHGILVGDVLVDVPDRVRETDRRRAESALSARAAGRQCMVMMDGTDIAEAVDRAVRDARARLSGDHLAGAGT
jgi:hypothetical protein